MFKLNCLLLVYKCVKSNNFIEFYRKLQKNSSLHIYETRNKNLLRPPLEKLKLFQNSYLYSSIVLWNGINDYTKKLNSIITYKKRVNLLLIEVKIYVISFCIYVCISFLTFSNHLTF